MVADLAHGYRLRSVPAVEQAPNVSQRGRELLIVVVRVRGCHAEKQDSGCGDADDCIECRSGVHLALRFSGPSTMPSPPSMTECVRTAILSSGGRHRAAIPKWQSASSNIYVQREANSMACGGFPSG